MFSSVSFSLPDFIENLTLISTVNGNGNALANTLIGNAGGNKLDGKYGADRLDGGAGSDVLIGGAGNDTLTGGADKDQFLFNGSLSASTNLDRITDFSVADDTIVLENAIFQAFSSTGEIASDTFYRGVKAKDAGDRLIYNKTTGGLFYDSDGTGSGGAVQIAELGVGLALTYKDFLII